MTSAFVLPRSTRLRKLCVPGGSPCKRAWPQGEGDSLWMPLLALIGVPWPGGLGATVLTRTPTLPGHPQGGSGDLEPGGLGHSRRHHNGGAHNGSPAAGHLAKTAV